MPDEGNVCWSLDNYFTKILSFIKEILNSQHEDVVASVSLYTVKILKDQVNHLNRCQITECIAILVQVLNNQTKIAFNEILDIVRDIIIFNKT